MSVEAMTTEHPQPSRDVILAWLVGLRVSLEFEIGHGVRQRRKRYPGPSPQEVLVAEGIVSDNVSKREVYADLDALVVLNGGRSVPLKD